MKQKYKTISFITLGVLALRIFSLLMPQDWYANFFSASVLSPENIISLTDESRTSEGLPPLKISKKLTAAAQKKAQDMIKNQYFSHFGPDQKAPWDWMLEENFNYLYAGENLAMHFQSSEDVINGWLTSPNHKKNIMDEKFSNIGIGIAHGNFKGVQSTVIVQMFGKEILLKAQKKTQKRPKRLIASKPSKHTRIQGVSTENTELIQYIHQLEKEKTGVYTPAKNFMKNFNLFYYSLVTCGILYILFYYFRSSWRKDRKFTLFVIANILILLLSTSS